MNDLRKKYRLSQLTAAVAGYLGAVVMLAGGVLGWNGMTAIGAVIFAGGWITVCSIGVIAWARNVK